MHRILIVLLFILGCGAPKPEPLDPSAARTERQAVAAVLDDWHAAAAAANEQVYFAHFSDDAIFLGTDATERWTVAAFHKYAHPFFARGRAWTFRAVRRQIYLNEAGDLAWFDEDLETENMGPARGSGVLRRQHSRTWKIAHYNLAITVPNDRFDEVRALLSAPPPVRIESK